MPDVGTLRSSLSVFAAEVGRPLAAWQAEALGLDVRTSVIVAPRQSGKSRSLAVLALWRAFREPGHRVLIVSAGEEAARRLLAEVRSVAVGSPLLVSSVVDDHAALVTLTNGSEVRSVPASERQVRGWTVDTLLVDEAAIVPDDLLLGAAIPTTAARPKARIVLASSATVASGAFFDHAVRGDAGSEHVRTWRWALGDADWITPSVIEAARESMTEARFRAEYEGVFASGADALFSRAALDRVVADYLPESLVSVRGPARLLAGVDWGATFDRSALVAVGRLAGERRFGVVVAHRWPAGEPLAAVIDQIAECGAHFDTVVMERNGIGEPCTQQLTDRLRRRSSDVGGGRPAPPFMMDLADFEERLTRSRRPVAAPAQAFVTRKAPVFTNAAMKAATYSALRLMVDHESLVLPASAEDLIRELLMLRVDLTQSGTERIEASTGHDDLADALMLATLPFRDRGSGRWRCYLADLADPHRPVPDPRLPERLDLRRLELVATASGATVPRRPAWQSVIGSQVTVPAGLDLRPPRDPWLSSVRAAVGAAVNPTPEGGG